MFHKHKAKLKTGLCVAIRISTPPHHLCAVRKRNLFCLFVDPHTPSQFSCKSKYLPQMTPAPVLVGLKDTGGSTTPSLETTQSEGRPQPPARHPARTHRPPIIGGVGVGGFKRAPLLGLVLETHPFPTWGAPERLAEQCYALRTTAPGRGLGCQHPWLC